MKGVITEYFEEKGYGFIKDENENHRFFHISDIKERNKFLDNIIDYFYTNWEERKCYVISFIPGNDNKGLNAVKINLTEQILNDASINNPFEAIITDFKYDTATLTRLVKGIRKSDSIPFGTTSGGNGTYRIGYPEGYRDLNIYFKRLDDIGWGTIDVRDIVLNLNDRSKITDQLVETFKEKLAGEKINIVSNNGTWKLIDTSILKT